MGATLGRVILAPREAAITEATAREMGQEVPPHILERAERWIDKWVIGANADKQGADEASLSFINRTPGSSRTQDLHVTESVSPSSSSSDSTQGMKITFTPGPGVTAKIIEGAPTTSSSTTSSSAKQAIIDDYMDLSKLPQAAYKPYPTRPKYVTLTPLLADPTPSAAMFETPYTERAKVELGSLFAPYLGKMFSTAGYNNTSSLSLNSALASASLPNLDHVKNPLSENTFVSSGPTSSSTSSLATVRIPASTPTKLMTVSPLQLNSLRANNVFSSPDEALSVLDNTGKKQKKKKFVPEEFAGFDSSSIASALPKHMRNEVYNDAEEAYNLPSAILNAASTSSQKPKRLVRTTALNIGRSSLRNELPPSIFPNIFHEVPYASKSTTSGKPSRKRRRINV
ncbi:MAG: hypothetical protein J6T34_01825 [Bacilli bacterium]|nr:hypothetical protein [Bacilli bacterium]